MAFIAFNSAKTRSTNRLVTGDFNLMLSAADKSNGNINRRFIKMFRETINRRDLGDIKLQGRRFTWSNEQHPPILAKLDRVLCSADWSNRFQSYALIPLASSISDHCPMLLFPEHSGFRTHRFKFENFWRFLDGFAEAVSQSWTKAIVASGPAHALALKLRRLGRDLRRWYAKRVGDIALQLSIGLNIIAQLDAAMDFRLLSTAEFNLRKELKLRVIGLAALDRIKWR